MDEDKEVWTKAAEKREQLVKMKSVHWCVSFRTTVPTSRVFRQVMTDQVEVERGANVAFFMS